MFAVKVKVMLIVESVVLCVVMTPVLNTMFDGLRHYTIIYDIMQCEIAIARESFCLFPRFPLHTHTHTHTHNHKVSYFLPSC